MPATIVFDVIETLLDLSAIDRDFDSVFGVSGVRQEWFSQLLLSSMAVTLTDDYRDFGELAGASLDMVARRRGVELSGDAARGLLMKLRELPPHPEVDDALDLLRSRGCRLATLTNSPPMIVQAQLKHAGLSRFFESSVSVDAVRKFKPAREVYDHCADQLGLKPETLWLVAAHNWDTSGALAAGWKAAFIERPGMVTGNIDREPTIRGRDLSEVVAKLLPRIAAV